MRSILYRMFFTAKGDLDTAQLMLVLYQLFFGAWIVEVGLKHWVLSEPMLDAFLIVYSTTVMLASPTWLVKMWIERGDWFRRSPSAVAAAVSGIVRPSDVPPVPPSAPVIGQPIDVVPPENRRSSDLSEFITPGQIVPATPGQIVPATPVISQPTSHEWIG